MIKKIILLLFSFCFIFLSCKKEIGRAPITYIPREVRTFFNFKTGSRWVFQDSISGNEFTHECSGVTNDSFVYINDYYKAAYEQMQISWPVPYPYSSYTAYNGITISTEPAHVIDGVFQINTFGKYYGQGGYSVNQGLYMVYPFVVGNHFINDNADTVIISDVLDHYTINSFTFDSVVVSDILYNHNNNLHNMRIYTAKGKGIIQYKALNDTTNYKVVDYHIE